MAVFFTLAIDCANREDVANSLQQIFDKFKIKILVGDKEELLPSNCHTYLASKYWGTVRKRDENDDCWIVCVNQPIYLGSIHRDFVTEPNIRLIRDQLYDRLKLFEKSGAGYGYRAARFGVEAQDYLGDKDWIQYLKEFLSLDRPSKFHEGLILDESLVDNDLLARHLVPFSPGYLWWDCYPDKYIG